MKQKWDIFCKIVDNFGDIGVCWRLSKQLANEYDLQVRLWIDDLNIAKHLIPGLNVDKISQTIQNIEIRLWHDGTQDHDHDLPEVVIEAFACEPPANFVARMKAKQPVWINLDYLSAEDWVDGFHGQHSIHPASGLKKYFFFPGFTEKTGGLIREQSLLDERDHFLTSSSVMPSFWKVLGVEPNNAVIVSLFCYPHAPIQSLLECMQQSSKPVLCLLPESVFSNEIASFFGKKTFKIGEKLTIGNLTLQAIPFLNQSLYDQLLWACDINFVRGEDSWVRAIWAGKPFIWQPYFQQEDAHIPKLESFIERFYGQAPEHKHSNVKTIMHACHEDWCKGALMPQHWEALLQNLAGIQAHHMWQSRQLALQADLAAKLVIFCKNRL